MLIAFRTDANPQIGTGHVMRCLALAEALHANGAQCCFLCRSQGLGEMADRIRAAGHHLLELPEGSPITASDSAPPHAHWLPHGEQQDAALCQQALATMPAIDWLVVDHYALGADWENTLRPFVKKILVIDDLADRQHDCNLLLDQTFTRNVEDYAKLTPNSCLVLTGSQYALLRPEFAEQRKYSLSRRGAHTIKNLLVSMGGSDLPNATGTALRAIEASALPADSKITIVMGRTSPWLENVREQAAHLPWPTEVLVDINNMASIMADCDLALGAAGTTSWERCSLGLPAIVITTADNQKKIALALAQSGAHWSLGDLTQINEHVISAAITHAANDPWALSTMSEMAKTICDGKGALRVANKILQPPTHLRQATFDDADLLFTWRNHPLVRQHFFEPREITPEQHNQWLASTLTKHQRKLLIGLIEERPAACLRLDIDGDSAEVSIYLAPEKMGMNLGSTFLSALAQWTKKNYPDIKKLHAKVLIDNHASQKAFENAGFRLDYLNFTRKL